MGLLLGSLSTNKSAPLWRNSSRLGRKSAAKLAPVGTIMVPARRRNICTCRPPVCSSRAYLAGRAARWTIYFRRRAGHETAEAAGSATPTRSPVPASARGKGGAAKRHIVSPARLTFEAACLALEWPSAAAATRTRMRMWTRMGRLRPIVCVGRPLAAHDRWRRLESQLFGRPDRKLNLAPKSRWGPAGRERRERRKHVTRAVSNVADYLGGAAEREFAARRPIVCAGPKLCAFRRRRRRRPRAQRPHSWRPEPARRRGGRPASQREL